MKLETFNYTAKQGWSVPSFPSLDSEKTLVLIFASRQFQNQEEPLLELMRAYPTSKIIGCSSAGEIFQNAILDNSIVVAVVKFNDTEIRIATATITTAEDTTTAAEKIAKELFAPNLSHVFILSDGTNINGTALVNGLIKHIPPKVGISGGLAGDAAKFETTWTLSNLEGLKSKSIVGIGFYGDKIKIATGSQGGWSTFGPARIITKSNKNILYEIDGQPILPLYKKYLGDHAKDLPASALLFPMAIRSSRDDPHKIVRTILSIDEKEQALIFAGDMPENWLAELMHTNMNNLIEGAADAASQISNKAKDLPMLTIAISCIGRRLVLGENTEDELQAVLDILPPNTKQVGFYSYGELSPSGVNQCDLHNQTMTLTSIWEI